MLGKMKLRIFVFLVPKRKKKAWATFSASVPLNEWNLALVRSTNVAGFALQVG